MNVMDVLRTDYLAISPDDTLSRVVGKLGKDHTEAVALDDKGKYVGMLWKRALIRSRVDPAATKVRKFITNPATLVADASLERVAQLMHNSDFHVLPVLDKGDRVLGIAGARDVLDALSARFAGIKASEVATNKLITLTETDPTGRAITLFREKKIDRIPILDSSGKLAGIVTLMDLISRFHKGTPQGSISGRGGKHGRTSKSGNDPGERPDYDKLPVGNIMTKLVVTASPNAKVADVIKLLRDNRISDVIMVQNDLPVGIVTTKDLLYEVSRT